MPDLGTRPDLPAPRPPERPSAHPRWLFPALERPADAVAHLTPGWFTCVMGTGIVAAAAVTLPVQVPGQRAFATALWLLAAALLVLLLAATAAHWARHPATARAHLAHPVVSHTYGAPPMALMTVGSGALLVGGDVVGPRAAVVLGAVLWGAGTLLGLVCAVVVPCVAFTRHENRPGAVSAGWLVPVVPPMVSAATGALLVPHLPDGQARRTLLLVCAAMFGVSLFASLLVLPLLWGRLAHHGVGAAAAVPALWLVLGPLGQSVTAAGLLARSGHGALPERFAAVADAAALLYGVPVWGFALLWAAVAAVLTARAVRGGMPFGLTWWSFTFPVGTVVTATSGLAQRTGLPLLTVAAVAFYGFLLVAWATVSVRTLRGAVDGRLLLPA
ncbi:TDT family transporter [Paenibacillus sp. TRM 82003]|uniref:TDT family transporter n=1 Tax=Kineococcus sp. TRM81007 TaxID=2925831 RepID=UPI001F5640B7|nr:TDT family transporter [Kineococcus sp. TRM81007]MCI2237383.1 TDT family transporter [Kineococcus sp. TRM81007]MCI3926510.1 TDT family transporter [Paenibacillus sp. TRM 82003]